MASSPALASSTPGMSIRCRRPGRMSGMMTNVKMSAITPNGRLTKKIQRQSNAVTSSPPRVGPAMVATPATAPHTPNAAPRRSAGNVLVMMVSVCGISMAAPSPWTARNPISQPALGARPHAAEATVNTAMPIANMIRGPIRSPSRPAVMTSTASTRA